MTIARRVRGCAHVEVVAVAERGRGGGGGVEHVLLGVEARVKGVGGLGLEARVEGVGGVGLELWLGGDVFGI